MATASARRQPKGAKRTIGFLGATNSKVWKKFVASFEDGLRDRKWVKGTNIAIKYEWAHGKRTRYASLAKKFARDGVDVIVTSGTQPALAAKRASPKIPIVFASAGDPAHGKVKLVKSLNKPGGNLTGLCNGANAYAGRRIDELRKVIPDLTELAIMGNPDSALIRVEMAQVAKEAKGRGLKCAARYVRRKQDIGATISAIKKKQIDEGGVHAIFVCTDPFITAHQGLVHKAALKAGLPTVHAFRDYVESGGLMSFGPDFRDMFFEAARLVDKILRGKKPSQLPVKLPKKTELVVNRDVAQTLGLNLSQGVRKRATFIR